MAEELNRVALTLNVIIVKSSMPIGRVNSIAGLSNSRPALHEPLTIQNNFHEVLILILVRLGSNANLFLLAEIHNYFPDAFLFIFLFRIDLVQRLTSQIPFHRHLIFLEVL